jgi:hypothetical protein
MARAHSRGDGEMKTAPFDTIQALMDFFNSNNISSTEAKAAMLRLLAILDEADDENEIREAREQRRSNVK